jgi:hypothetical protein
MKGWFGLVGGAILILSLAYPATDQADGQGTTPIPAGGTTTARNDPNKTQQPPSQVAFTVPSNVALHPPPEQPIAFSHKLHVGFGLQCTHCHENPAGSNHISLPPVKTCMTCHVAVDKDKPNIQRLAGYAASGQAVPWARIYPLTAGIHFNHEPHLKAGVPCTNCHGPVGDQTAMSELTAITSMATCISCHQAFKAPKGCETCHGWPIDDPSVLGRWSLPAPLPFAPTEPARSHSP